ncbi:Y-family DNA polymerase [Olsenella massiliensis]|uniref:Y-family DNA polymerase n=1 Tax=Olsenella massiliensis TaxID=1622075 RepID=UPI00071CBCD9|nr:DNA repair protein [Olsenella massiliensis]
MHGLATTPAGAGRTSPRQRWYLVVDLKSFYASVECVERGLDPLTARLVVADPTRTQKTICLAASPALKALGVRNRCRVFEIPTSIDYLMASPRMALYIERSADVYAVYLRYVSPEDIHVYSIDEAFLDVTPYLGLYGCTARELAERIRQDVMRSTGIPAACGVGTNLYLAKVALDITAKHSPDSLGILTQESYRQTLWDHRPLTDFWRVGPATARRLAALGVTTMGQLASHPPEPLYRTFGVDAEILIDHAWGVEPVTIADVKSYRPRSESLSNGQVLAHDTDRAGGLVIAKEMADALTLELVERGLVCSSLSLMVGYKPTPRDGHVALGVARRAGAHPGDLRRGELREAGGVTLSQPTSSLARVWRALEGLYGRVVTRDLPVHRLSVCLGGVGSERAPGTQMSLLDDGGADDARERRRQEAISAIKGKFGKNALIKGIDLLPGATARERNAQIGGHRSGVEEG